LGASTSGISIHLSWNIIKWILISNVIVWPVAHYAMNKWIQSFAYRTSIRLWTFLFSGHIILVIALLIMSYQAIKAAKANPVDSLRYE